MQDRIFAVKDGSSWVIREIVTNNGLYIVWPGRYRTVEACMKAIRDEMIFCSNRR